MYAIGNVVKFLEDHVGSICWKQKVAILERALEQSKPDGVLMSGMARDVWQDDELLEKFYNALTTNADHMEIGVTTIRQAHQR